MMYHGYISNELTPAEVDAIRQTQATLELEQLKLEAQDISEIAKLVQGKVTREEFQRRLKTILAV